MARPKQLPSGAWQVRWRDPTGKERKQTFRRKMDATDFTPRHRIRRCTRQLHRSQCGQDHP